MPSTISFNMVDSQGTPIRIWAFGAFPFALAVMIENLFLQSEGLFALNPLIGSLLSRTFFSIFTFPGFAALLAIGVQPIN